VLSKYLSDLQELKIIKKQAIGRTSINEFTKNGKNLLNMVKMLKGWCSMNDLNVPKGCDFHCIGCKYLRDSKAAGCFYTLV
jgi:hypothetical protein